MEAILRTLKATADPSRLRILRTLERGTFHVAELTEILGLAQSTVSKHLRLLSEAGLVAVRRAGTWAFYSLGSPPGERFDGALLGLLRDGLSGENGEQADRDRVGAERVLARHRRERSEFFRRSASRWDRLRDEALGPPAHLERLGELAGDGGTVVDLGTGTGVLLPGLARRARAVIGVDASAEMLDGARRRLEGEGLAADLRLGALEHLPLRDGEADTMVANLVLHHVADPPAVFREVLRGLSRGGRLIVAELEEHDDPAFWQGLGARWPGFRVQDLKDWLEAAGFHGVRTEIPQSPRRPRVFLMEARSPNPRRRSS